MAEEVRAHITGTVWKIEVEIGEEVEEDDDLVILESMKMEMPVPAPCDGIVKEIRIKEGDAVEEDQVLVIMAES
ncbi:acetyl-CoA carboxylase biotin carboxyl carrier protein subunit [Lujinxingia litoralis]|uniref:Acetyl-CoA carboxylase biotin carboxyl carrier protein subunit n=1 Tax=Lujinxingia litoralis TaxID=2211119 RepID=A0A328CAX7_9DELT|nr:biotin/lipoyl-binding carrier protein [Lujinxingia litoralis]RAL23619.1 acetyl-CoA carboxylase biotin carboxyl carrier protein subunit [Lujinxingia litoralis]